MAERRCMDRIRRGLGLGCRKRWSAETLGLPLARHGARIAASTARARSASCRLGRPVRCSRDQSRWRGDHGASERGLDPSAVRRLLARRPGRAATDVEPEHRRHVAGRSPLAGDYNGVDAVLGFFGKLIELSGGTFQVQLHDAMANDMHVASPHTNRAERIGRRLDLRVVLISHVRDGKSVEVWDFTRTSTPRTSSGRRSPLGLREPGSPTLTWSSCPTCPEAAHHRSAARLAMMAHFRWPV
jgi:ketosteroid isomerase-like protein